MDFINSRKFRVLFWVMLFIFTFQIGGHAFAQGDPLGDAIGIDDFKIQDLFRIISGIACWLVSFSILALVVFIVLAGIRFMTAGANREKALTARKNFMQVFIAALVLYGVYIIIISVANAVGVESVSLIPLDC